jgi:hypothetical protein
MTKDRIDEEEARRVGSTDRRQFLRSAVQIGSAAALLLTSASRQVLAGSLTLSPNDLEAARRARQTPGASPSADRAAGRLEASAASPSGTCTGCEGGCAGTCTGGCSDGCTGACSGTCSGTCKGGCASGCTAANK